MNKLIGYFENLARAHSQVLHTDEECHFSSLLDDAQNSFARRMHYPCVCMELGDINFSGSLDSSRTEQVVTLFFLDHVADAGDYEEIQTKLDNTCTIMKDFVKRMVRDRKAGVKLMSRFDPTGLEAHSIYHESAGLYGWVLMMTDIEPLSYLDCEGVWMD